MKLRTHRSPRRSLCFLTVGVALLAGCGGSGNETVGVDPCQVSNSDSANYTVVLFDVSNSTGTDAARSRYREGLETILRAHDNGGPLYGEESEVAVGAIDASTQVSFDPTQCQYPKKGSAANPLVHQSKVNKAHEGLREPAIKIIDGPRGEHGTDILDALDGVGRLFERNEGAERKSLILFSDMVEESERARRLKESDCQRLAQQAQTKLDSVRTYVVGAGVSSTQIPPERVDEVRKFWKCYVEALGGELASTDYGPTLLGFP